MFADVESEIMGLTFKHFLLLKVPRLWKVKVKILPIESIKI